MGEAGSATGRRPPGCRCGYRGADGHGGRAPGEVDRREDVFDRLLGDRFDLATDRGGEGKRRLGVTGDDGLPETGAELRCGANDGEPAADDGGVRRPERDPAGADGDGENGSGHGADLERALEGAMFFYRFGAGAAQKGFLERPWNDGDLATAVEMPRPG